MTVKHGHSRSWWSIGAVAMLFGCATPAPLHQHLAAGPLQECARFFVAVDQAVGAVDGGDPVNARVVGFPYLRVNRFLASFRHDLADDRAFAAWVERMQGLDRVARGFELAKLPPEQRDDLRALTPKGKGGLSATVTRCGDELRRADLADPATHALLRRRASVPDEYRTARRVFGIYPLTALFFLHGIGNWHEETLRTFARPLAQLPQAGTLLRYVPSAQSPPMTPAELAAVLRHSADDPLGVPRLSLDELARLFAAFAPIWEIDVTGLSDRIGTPVWHDDTIPAIDTDAPVVYQQPSYVRVNRQVLLQLNYVVWFPERPRTGKFDLLSGHLDGITWRVTLTPDGQPLLYDSIHNCGCYHMFFPTPRLHRKTLGTDSEPPLLPQSAPEPVAGLRTVIRVAHLTHYIERVYTDRKTGGGAERAAEYPLTDYDALRALPAAGGGRRGLFRPDGIVPGSDRAERWFFWPMGIPAPGAMRAWGHQATAFVGRRHFDDADLIEKLFEVDLERGGGARQ